MSTTDNDAKEALRIAASDLVDHLRRSGPENLTASELVTVRAWFSVLSPSERVRAVYCNDDLVEPEVDNLWNTFGREPLKGEYLALAKLCLEAAKKCERDADELEERPVDACPDCDKGLAMVAGRYHGAQLVRCPCPTCKGTGKRS